MRFYKSNLKYLIMGNRTILTIIMVLTAISCTDIIDPPEDEKRVNLCLQEPCDVVDQCTYGTCVENLTSAGDNCPSNDCVEDLCAPSVPILGSGTHSITSLDQTIIGSSSNYLSNPTDLAFNSDDPSQLWVLNRQPPGVVIFFHIDTEDQSSNYYASAGTSHFMARPSALAFGNPGIMATIHDTADRTQGPPPDGTPPEFMGPTLHATDVSIFDAGHGSHLDMLHNSPLGKGIAWQKDNIYWVFDGYHSSITMYDFQSDHGLGGKLHHDGIVRRYIEGQVQGVAGIPSHLAMDRTTGLLYIADTGNNRIAVLDTNTGILGNPIYPNFDRTDQRKVIDATLETLVDGDVVGLNAPSGIVLADNDMLFVTDNVLSRVYAFSTISGELIDWLDTGISTGSLMGIDLDSNGSMYLIDGVSNRVLRFSVTTPVPNIECEPLFGSDQ